MRKESCLQWGKKMKKKRLSKSTFFFNEARRDIKLAGKLVEMYDEISPLGSKNRDKKRRIEQYQSFLHFQPYSKNL
ncbi:MAG: hypothetical protein GOP50_02695 [Candidatus Heimdallarchaeota archaeon]|nr:hypothetical protein [Candidatus Heimdallarchaeota archaeon]